MNETTMTLWSLLGDHDVSIPLFQRDYAQGRDDAVYVRRAFLKRLRDAVDEWRETSAPLVLDFVYGPMESNVFWPLDGQQRLTTLWLLHWYLAFRSGEPTMKASRNFLRRFSYETRDSARRFCGMLVDLPADNPPAIGNLATWIRDRIVFEEAFLRDPTVTAMLHMIGGEDPNEPAGDDTLEGVFGGVDSKRQQIRLESLRRGSVKFHVHLMSETDGISPDDLYVKMNARGKPLTDFENFKADLVSIAGSDPVFASNLDNAWTDLFWTRRFQDSESGRYSIDGIYLEFFRRFLLGWVLAETTEGGALPARTWTAGKKGTNNDFDEHGRGLVARLFHSSRYLGMDPKLKDVLEKGALNAVSSTLGKLARLHQGGLLEKVEVTFLPVWGQGDNISLLPVYVRGKEDVRGITYPARVAFYAACRYLERCGDFDESRFAEWMRFVWNVAENAPVEDVLSMVGAIRFVREASAHAADIEAFLANSTETPFSSNFATRQVAEEVRKAKLRRLYRNHADSDIPDWPNLIVEAEKTAFFHGSLSCLATKAEWDSYLAGSDATVFALKLGKASKLFDSTGLVPETASAVCSALVRALPKWSLLYDRQLFDTRGSEWKTRILANPDYESAVDSILRANTLEDVKTVPFEGQDDSRRTQELRMDVKQILAASDGLLHHPGVVASESKWRLRFNWFLSFYPKNGKGSNVFVLDTVEDNYDNTSLRNRLIPSLPGVEILSKNVVANGNIVFCEWDVRFRWQGAEFAWEKNGNAIRIVQSEPTSKEKLNNCRDWAENEFEYALRTFMNHLGIQTKDQQIVDHLVECSARDLPADAWLEILLNSFGASLVGYSQICQWEKFSGSDWAKLLSKCRQFADKCDWSKLSGKDWTLLLEDRPEFAEKCEKWTELDDEDWTLLLNCQPQFSKRQECPLTELGGSGWSAVLRSYPEMADQCAWDRLNGSNWASLLQLQPQFADRCPWDRLNGLDWETLLVSQPQFGIWCNWDKLAGINWAVLLKAQPQFADKCRWDTFRGWDWAVLLGGRPEFSDRCQWSAMKGLDWVKLLSDNPSFADRCPWDKLDDDDWDLLLSVHPQFADKRPVS